MGMSKPDRSRGTEAMPELSIILERPPLESTRTALVVIDMVNWQASPRGGFLSGLRESGVDTGYIERRCGSTVVPNIQRLLAAARASGATTIYTRLGCRRPDFTDTVPALRAQFRRNGALDGNRACEVIDELTPEDGDISLLKTGSGAFATCDLEPVLRESGIEHVVYTGVVTNACVLLSVGSGFDLGYYGYLVSDATATFSQQTQDATEEIVSGYMAEVVTTDDVLGRMA